MKKGFTLVEILVVTLAVVSLAAIAIPTILRSRINANETAAQKLVRDIAVASETYAFANKGLYPSSASNLTGADGGVGNPSLKYLTEDFTQGIRYGYNFTTTFTSSGYTCTASPVNCNRSGNKNFSIATKGNVVISDCVPPTCTAPTACGTYPDCVACSCSPQCGTYPDCVACVCTAPTACGTYPNCRACTCGDIGQCGTWGSCHTCTCADLGKCGTWGNCYLCPCTPFCKGTLCVSCCGGGNPCGGGTPGS